MALVMSMVRDLPTEVGRPQHRVCDLCAQVSSRRGTDKSEGVLTNPTISQTVRDGENAP